LKSFIVYSYHNVFEITALMGNLAPLFGIQQIVPAVPYQPLYLLYVTKSDFLIDVNVLSVV